MRILTNANTRTTSWGSLGDSAGVFSNFCLSESIYNKCGIRS